MTLIQRLQTEWDWPDPALLREIMACGEDAVAPLSELLTPDLVQQCKTDERADALAYYVMRLLGETHSLAAVPLLIPLFAALDDRNDFSDDLIEALPGAVLALGRPEAIGPLLDVVLNEQLSWYPRSAAAETAVSLAGADPMRRAQIADALRPRLAERVRRAMPIFLTPYQSPPRDRNWMRPINGDDSDIVAELVSALSDVNDLASRPLIESAFRAGLVNTRMTDMRDIDEDYAEGGKTKFSPPAPWMEWYEDSYRKHFAGQDQQDEDIQGKRLGRNDACWCGSGKKYKKCHLAEDEKGARK